MAWVHPTLRRYLDVFVALTNTQSQQQEVLALLGEHLLPYCPAVYQPLKDSSGLYNLKTQQIWHFADFATAPLDLAARLIPAVVASPETAAQLANAVQGLKACYAILQGPVAL
ncbi:MAG: hypothetical protein WA885_21350 [Phormidesmis sp.]